MSFYKLFTHNRSIHYKEIKNKTPKHLPDRWGRSFCNNPLPAYHLNCISAEGGHALQIIGLFIYTGRTLYGILTQLLFYESA
jgi:hypothetical protein